MNPSILEIWTARAKMMLVYIVVTAINMDLMFDTFSSTITAPFFLAFSFAVAGIWLEGTKREVAKYFFGATCLAFLYVLVEASGLSYDDILIRAILSPAVASLVLYGLYRYKIIPLAGASMSIVMNLII